MAIALRRATAEGADSNIKASALQRNSRCPASLFGWELLRTAYALSHDLPGWYSSVVKFKQ